MKIGIDIDEVVVEFVRGYLKLFNEKFEKNFKFEDIFTHNLWECLGMSKEESFKLTEEFVNHHYLDEMDLIEGVQESINNLIKNHEIVYITARSIKFKDKTKIFLNKHFPNKEFGIIHSGEMFGGNKTKGEICNELGVDLLIEDNEKITEECSEKGVRVFLMDKPWNKNVGEHENIIRVKGWNEIMEKIDGH